MNIRISSAAARSSVGRETETSSSWGSLRWNRIGFCFVFVFFVALPFFDFMSIVDSIQATKRTMVYSTFDSDQSEETIEDTFTVRENMDQQKTLFTQQMGQENEALLVEYPSNAYTKKDSTDNIGTVTTSYQQGATKYTISNTTEQHCAVWEDNQDEWFQNHPDWQVSKQNDTHLCFTPMKNIEMATYYREMHRIQFVDHNNCTKPKRQANLIGTGFAAAVKQLTIAFYYSFKKEHKLFVPSKHWRPFRWIYNPPYNASLDISEQPIGACETQDLFCFYLPVTNCDYIEQVSDTTPRRFVYQDFHHNHIANMHHRNHISYLTRFNQETRHRLYILYQEIAPVPIDKNSMAGNCIAFHVRRTDATSERRHPRNFYYLQDYINGAKTITNLMKGDSFVLLTDDQSTIEEAKYIHPEYNWLYINRTRYYGAQRRNSHIPSGNPGLEFINIYADLQLASNCHTLVHGTSNMVTFIVHAMEEAMANRNPDGNRLGRIKTIQIDANKNNVTYIKGSVFMKELNQRIEDAKTRQSLDPR